MRHPINLNFTEQSCCLPLSVPAHADNALDLKHFRNGAQVFVAGGEQFGSNRPPELVGSDVLPVRVVHQQRAVVDHEQVSVNLIGRPEHLSESTPQASA